MIFLFLMFLCLPLALLLSFCSGLSVMKHNTVLGAAILFTSVLGLASLIWELRFDIELISYMFSYEQLSADFQAYFLALYLVVFALVLLARLRWDKQQGKGFLLVFALMFWAMAPAPYYLISPGAYLH